MLPFRSRWHVAANGIPSGEARLLWFAAGDPTPEDAANDPANSPETNEQDQDIQRTLAEGAVAPEEREATVQERQGGARRKAQGVVENPLEPAGAGEKKKPLHVTVVEQTRAVNALFREIHTIMDSKAVKEYVHTLNAKERKEWESGKHFLRNELLRIAGHLLIAETAANWMEDATENPHVFIETMKNAYKDEENEREIAAALDQVRSKHAADLDRWLDLSPHIRQDIIQEFQEAAQLTRKLETIQATMKIYQETAQVQKAQIEEWAKQTEEAKGKMNMDGAEQNKKAAFAGNGHTSIRGSIRGIFGGMGIRFYSPLEVMEAFRSIKEAYKRAFQDKTRLNGALLAKNVSGLLKWGPYGREIELTLDSDLESQHNKAAREWQESLEARDVGWKDLFGHNGMIDTLIGQGEREKAMGVLQYAASRGWLYDIDESATRPAWAKTIFGRSLKRICPSEWTDQGVDGFYSVMRSKNMSGLDDEIGKGTKGVQGIENTPYFIQRIDEEMSGVNLWAAVGIAARAINRGLYAEVSPWILTTVLHHLFNDPDVSRCANSIFIDKMGKLAAYRSAFSVGALQADREGWIKCLRGEKGMEEAPYVGKIVLQLQQDILAACQGRPSSADLNHAVALVMSAQMLTPKTAAAAKLKTLFLKPDTKISIFSSKYAYYRSSELAKSAVASNPGIGEEDTDYFTQITDNQLAGQQVQQELYKSDGNGGFRNDDKVPDYSGNVLKQYDILAKNGLVEEAENFRNEMGPKITYGLQKAFNDQRSGAMYIVKLRRHHIGQPLLKTLVIEGFFDIGVVIDAYWQDAAGKDLARNLLRQVDANLLEKLEKLKSSQTADKQRQFAQLSEQFKRVPKRRCDHWPQDVATPGQKKGAAGAQAAEAQLNMSF